MIRPPITGKARLAGVIGHPVSHSLSPVLHNYWLGRYGIDGAYVPLPVAPDDFVRAVRGLQCAGFRGANVTIPHKESAFAIADTVDPEARVAGSVNTLVFGEDGRIHGSSTDGYGFIENLRAGKVSPEHLKGQGKALILGAGGAARSVATALLRLGFSVVISNRTHERAETLRTDLSRAWQQQFGGASAALSVVPWDKAFHALADAALLVNTTSLGMSGGPDASWCPDLSRAPAHLVVTDIVYVPQETPLLRAAALRGLVTVDGLGMLLHQARPGFRAWFGADAQVDDETVRYVTAALRH